MNETAEKVKVAFNKKFSTAPRFVYSPGRINLIGEHVDYNDGYVMPAAINKGIYFGIAYNHSSKVNFYSVDFDESISVPLSEIKKMDGWKNYVLSVINEFQELKLPLQGFDCAFGGDIPIGGGISSSAALEGGVSFGINELFHFKMKRKELALLGQRAEHNFPNVKCGIMDQYANMLGKKDAIVLLDCKNVTHEHVPLNLEGYTIVLINTKVHHSLASSAYNQRRNECEQGLKVLEKELHIQSFRDFNDPASLLQFKSKMDEIIYRRCEFVVGEINRTRKAAQLLKENNLIDFGKLMFETHDGLKNQYEVSCRELDFLVDKARANKNVIGARLMGGGFGGCTINIVKEKAASSFLSEATADYKKQFGIDPESYVVKVVDGTGEILSPQE